MCGGSSGSELKSKKNENAYNGKGVKMASELEGRITFWKDSLSQYRWGMNPSVQYQIEQTIKDLEHLKERQEKDEPAAVKK